MKNLSSSVAKSNAQITAKKIAKTLNRAIKTGANAVGTGLKVGGVVTLGAGTLVGCESTPAFQTQTLEGPVVRSYERAAPDGKPATYFVVDTDGNLETTTDQKHIVIGHSNLNKIPGITDKGATVRFRWDAYNEQHGIAYSGDIIMINGQIINQGR